jgi:cytochrome P450
VQLHWGTSQTCSLAPRARALEAAVQQAAVSWPQRWFDSNRISGLGLLRRNDPVAALGPAFAVVTRREDVLAVLDDADTFGTPYGPRLPGPFVLGLSGAEHRRQRQQIRAALRDQDLGPLTDQAGALAAERVASAAPAGRLDVGTELVHPVLNDIVAEYLGVTGPDATTLLRWSRDLFDDIFLNAADLPVVRRRAEVAAQQMTARVGLEVAGGTGRDERVVRRLLADRPTLAVVDHAEISTELIGLTIGWLWHGSKAAVIAVDELLERPEALAHAQSAARSGDLAQLRRLLWEVLRFRPVQIGLLRVCRQDTVVAAGTARARKLRAGTSVLVGTHSAMWDETAVPDPGRFDPSRAAEQYLVFGHGPHRCMGEDIMGVQLPALLAPLLAVRGLRRAPGRSGRLRWAGPHPDGFSVAFTA